MITLLLIILIIIALGGGSWGSYNLHTRYGPAYGGLGVIGLVVIVLLLVYILGRL